MNSLWRIAKLLLMILLISGSLLAFPKWLPVVVFFWIFAVLVQDYRNAQGHENSSRLFPLLILAIVLAAKNPEWSVMLAVLLGVLSFTLGRSLLRPDSRMPLYHRLSMILVAGTFWLDFSVACKAGNQSILANNARIACLGDSLTDYGYPQELQKLTSHLILDFGRDGITSADGLEILPKILQQEPNVLVLELGGHDFNQGHVRSVAKANLSAIIESCQENSVVVVLVAIPRGFIRDPFRGLERELARKYDLELIPDSLIRQFVLYSNICPPGTWLPVEKRLSNDGLHPNENGNRLFAGTVYDRLKRLGLVK